MNMAIVMLIVIVLAIAIGFKTNINIGVLAMVFSYIAGCYVMGLKASAIVAMWPIKIFFILVSVSFFYNFATLNGSLDKLALNILYRFGKQSKIIPFVAFAAAWLMSGMGAGPYGIIFLLCPILFVICNKINMNKLMIGLAVYFGAVSGGAFPTSSTGAVVKAIISDAGFADSSMSFIFTIFICETLAFLLFFTIMYFFVFKGYQTGNQNVAIDKPEPYTDAQKKSLALIAVFILLLLGPYLLAIPFANSSVVKALVQYNDVGFIALLMAVVSSLLKLADERKALASVPWNTVIMISGVGIIVGVAVNAGTVDMMINAVSATENSRFVPAFMSGIAGIMTLFSSATGVVFPTLYPMVKGIAEATGLTPGLLFTVIATGSVFAGMSPLSACGGLIMGCVSENEIKSIYKNLFIVSGAGIVFSMFLSFAATLII
ncbi:SLC13 family permease [Lacrimispora sp.]|uniref:SLC13 family permease n=1 Tax=Lacrimispora sp. TaxID=2719234 RepID=UPI002897B18B|nr:SLC13 family permease [Lacrimispora sp.]